MALFEKTPWYFWLVVILGLVWFSMGAYDYVMTVTKNETYLSIMTDAQRQWIEGRPMWFSFAWAISIWSAIVGSLLLVFRRRIAGTWFLVSLVGYLIACIYSYILSDPGAIEVSGTLGLVMGIMIGVSLLLFVMFSANMSHRGILR